MYEFIGILLGARPILPISRLKVKTKFDVSDTFYETYSAFDLLRKEGGIVQK
jgi:hypothetical protein